MGDVHQGRRDPIVTKGLRPDGEKLALVDAMDTRRRTVDIELVPTIGITGVPPRPRTAAVTVRSSTRADLAAIRDHFECLDDEGRRLRFHGMTSGVPQAVLDVFCGTGRHDRITRVAVAGAVVPGEAMLVAVPGSADAELALSVAAHRRREGIGRRLLSSLVAAAGHAGFASVHVDVLPENTAFIALSDTFGFAKRWHPKDPTVLRMTQAVRTDHAPDR